MPEQAIARHDPTSGPDPNSIGRRREHPCPRMVKAPPDPVTSTTLGIPGVARADTAGAGAGDRGENAGAVISNVAAATQDTRP